MNEIEVFTDGACRGNPGPGGWGVLLRIDGEEITLFGGDLNTTNNRMELKAAIKALEYFDDKVSLSISTDSNYVKDGITKWLLNWKKNNWVTGHAGHRENEIADMLANKGIDEL